MIEDSFLMNHGSFGGWFKPIFMILYGFKTKFVYLDKGNSSIPLFKTHKSMDKKQNRGNKPKPSETH